MDIGRDSVTGRGNTQKGDCTAETEPEGERWGMRSNTSEADCVGL